MIATHGVVRGDEAAGATRFVVARREARTLTAGFALSTIVGLVLVASGLVHPILLVVVFFDAGLAMVLLPALRLGRFDAVLTPAGLRHRGRFVPWAAIRGSRFDGERGSGFLMLDVDPSRSVMTRGFGSLTRHLRRGDLRVPLSWLEADGALLVAVVERVLEHPDERALLGDPGGADGIRRLLASR